MISYRWLLLRETTADDRGRVSGVRACGPKDGRRTVHGTDRVHVPDGGGGLRSAGGLRRLLRRFRSDGRTSRRRLHAAATRHAVIAGHADQEPETVGGPGQHADRGSGCARVRRTKVHAEKSQLPQRPIRHAHTFPGVLL